MFEQKNNRGALWKNENKRSENHPDFKGTIVVDGKHYWFSGWKRRPDANPASPALSVAVTLKEMQPQAQATADQYAAATGAQEPQQGFDDDIPF
jgi:hypothetical protein